MKKFEYDVIEIPNSAINGIKGFLNGLGAEGWEIIHFASLSGSIAARLLVKREIEDNGDQVPSPFKGQLVDGPDGKPVKLGDSMGSRGYPLGREL